MVLHPFRFRDEDRVLADVRRQVSDPLKVWVDSTSTVSGEQAGFPAAVRAAITEWASTGIPIRFQYVGSARDADIRVRWTEFLDKKTGCRDAGFGLAQYPAEIGLSRGRIEDNDEGTGRRRGSVPRTEGPV